MKVLLVGNYEFDGSKSMQVWAEALHRELRARGVDAELISPRPVLGKLKPSAVGVGKWLGYVDRFVLFPRRLRAAAEKADIVHLCDHGSAMFALKLKKKTIVVTCHDMLAVRGALGEIPEMRASAAGRLLQNWICRGLRQATQVACVSQFTMEDATRVLGTGKNLCKVLNGLNYPFRQLDAAEADRRLASVPEIRDPFIVHVGSNHARKNRDGVLRIFAMALKKKMDLQLVFAGVALTDQLRAMAAQLGLGKKIVELVNPDVKTVEALYNRAAALIFPSRYEGFGWPPIEAQACGCPVVASAIPPIIETIGESGVLLPVEDEIGMADSIVRLAGDSGFRDELRCAGSKNALSRFQTSRMMDDYLSLYQRILPKVQNNAAV
jgi:glycosyltransferase involved in cell wall biosynthesis